VPPDQCMKDLLSLLNDLRDRELITVQQEPEESS
jgi:hypothetical protein